MRKLHAGLDGLDVNFQGAVSPAFVRVLESARERAQAAEKPMEYVDWKGETLGVYRSGAKGFKFMVDTGPDGEVWKIADSDRTDAWNISVSCRSAGLVARGYQETKRRLFAMLDLFGAVVVDHRVGRVDVCVDLEMEDFAPRADLFRAHSRATVSQQFADFAVVGYGRKVSSITVGRMPGRQVILYDKRREAIDRRKTWWFDVWGVGRDASVWRVEVRFGRDALADHKLSDGQDLRTFETLERGLGAAVSECLGAVSYLDPDQTDSNVSRQRLHPMWEAAAGILKWTVIDAMRTRQEGVDRSKVIEGTRAVLRDRFQGLIGGLTASLLVVEGVDPEQGARAVAEGLTEAIERWCGANQQRFRDGVTRARRRLRILDAPETVEV